MGSDSSEHPILFNGAMVHAILDGSKTVTRRVVTPQPIGALGRYSDGWADDRWYERDGAAPDGPRIIYCPYGTPGDRLWVRETWAYNGQASRNCGPKGRRREGYVTYAADRAKVTHTFTDGPMLPSPPQTTPTRRDGEDEFAFTTRTDDYYKNYFRRMRPSIHMPRWASRLTLEVTEVRAQRLQEISEEDAQAEGVERLIAQGGWRNYGVRDLPEESNEYWASARDSFMSLWDSINGERDGCSWEANPWVWAVTFKKITRRTTGDA